MHVKQTGRFQKAVKKLHPNQKQALDTAIKQLIETPDLGELKKAIWLMCVFINLKCKTSSLF